MSSPYTKIVYGNPAADAIGEVLGWAASDNDMSIEAIGNETTTQVDGATGKVVISGHGLQASGNVIVPTAAVATAYIGMIVKIAPKSAPNAFRPYRVTAWSEQVDEETGLAVAAFTAISEDSMVAEYLIGPRDPETGEPYGDQSDSSSASGSDSSSGSPVPSARFWICAADNVFSDAGTGETHSPVSTWVGATIGLFAQNPFYQDGDLAINAAVANVSNAVATAVIDNSGLLGFDAPDGTYYVAPCVDAMQPGWDGEHGPVFWTIADDARSYAAGTRFACTLDAKVFGTP